MTWKPQVPAWQCRCWYHNRYTQPRCTKTLSYSGPVQGEESQAVLRQLKHWALKASQCDSKESHCGRRGLSALTPAELALGDDHLDAKELELPDPPA